MDWIDKMGGVTGAMDSPDIVKWTVTVKIPGEPGKAISGAEIVDVLQKGIKLIQGDIDHPIEIKYDSDSTATTVPTTSYNYDSALTGDTFTYIFDSTNPPTGGTNVVLTFYTEAKDRNAFLNSNDPIPVSNKATLTWDDSADITKSPSTTYEISGSEGIGGGGLLSKTADENGEAYLYDNTDIIEWTIVVNRSAITMTNAQIEDQVPAGQELLIDALHPLTVKDSSDAEVQKISSKAPTTNFEYEEASSGILENFKYKLPTPITETHTITYYTTITDEGRKELYANGTIIYKNKVKLTRDGEDVIIIEGEKKFSSQMLAKSIPTAYDYDSHLIQWKLTVNRNQLPLTGATVTDTLPEGMVLVIDDEGHPFQVGGITTPVSLTAKEDTTYLTITSSTREKFEYNLGSEADKKTVTITFWSKMTDDALKKQWKIGDPGINSSGGKEFTNKAELVSDKTDKISTSKSTTIKNPFISKTHDREVDNGKDTIHWEVFVNQAQVEITGGKIIDELNAAFALETSTIKLYKVNVKADGTADEDNKIKVNSDDYTIDLPTAANENTLTVRLPSPTTSAFILEFDTIILDNSQDLTNTVRVEGSEIGDENNATSEKAFFANLYSSFGSSGSNTLTVEKVDKDDNSIKLKDAEFRLLSAGKMPISDGGKEVTTDSNGEASFGSLPSWTFYVEETEPPMGYLLPKEKEDRYFFGEKLSGNENLQIVQIDNIKASIDIVIDKKGAGGVPLSGGNFRLEGKDFAGNDVSIEAPSVAGTVTFTGVPIDYGQVDPSYEGYTIKELSPPSGYRLTTDTIKATVRYNDDKTDVVLTQSDTKLENVRRPKAPVSAKIVINKKGDDDKKLEGAEFTLYDKDDKVVEIVITDKNGVALFESVDQGSGYKIKETKAPEGYEMNDETINFSVISSIEQTYTVINTKLDEPEDPDKPGDPDDPNKPGDKPGDDDDSGILGEGDEKTPGSTNLPKTDDPSLLFLWLMTMAGALLGIYLLIRKKPLFIRK